MAEKTEQEKPLAPGIHSTIIDVDKRRPIPAAAFISRRRQLCLKCCGCSTALLLILVVTIIILMITVFHIKDPTLELNSLKINGLDWLSNKTNGHNMTLEADVTIKNPNVAAFKFDKAATEVYYDGTVVGEVGTAAGEAGARKTRRMSVWIDVMIDRIVGVKRFESDFVEGILVIGLYTRVSGKVKIADVMSKSVVVKMNCTMSWNLTSHVIQDRTCRRN